MTKFIFDRRTKEQKTHFTKHLTTNNLSIIKFCPFVLLSKRAPISYGQHTNSINFLTEEHKNKNSYLYKHLIYNNLHIC